MVAGGCHCRLAPSRSRHRQPGSRRTPGRRAEAAPRSDTARRSDGAPRTAAAGAKLRLSALGIPDEEFVSRFEGIIGDAIHDTALYWGKLNGAAVEVSRGCPDEATNCQTLHVDLDLAASVPGPNPEVNINFDVHAACVDDDLVISTSDLEVDADSSVISRLVTLGAIELLDRKIEDGVKEKFKGIERTITGVGDCRVYVDDFAGLRIEETPT